MQNKVHLVARFEENCKLLILYFCKGMSLFKGYRRQRS